MKKKFRFIDIKNREGFPDENDYLNTVSDEVWANASMEINQKIATQVIEVTRRIVNQLKQERHN